MKTDDFNRAQSNHDAQTPNYGREPTEAEIEKVAASILKHLMENPNEWHDAFISVLEQGKPEGLGESLRDGDYSMYSSIDQARKLIVTKLTEDAREMAENWLHNDLTKWQKQRLADWYPVRYPMASREQHWEMM